MAYNDNYSKKRGLRFFCTLSITELLLLLFPFRIQQVPAMFGKKGAYLNRLCIKKVGLIDEFRGLALAT